MIHRIRCVALLAAALFAPATLATAFAATRTDAALTTTAERSGFLKTGRYDEVIALCEAFARRYPQAVRCTDFGTTPEGRPMKLLVASTRGALTPESARAQGLPVTLIQGGIHAGEIDTSMMLALRPDVVEMAQAQNFASTSEDRAKAYPILGNGKSAKLGWQMQDYNAAGAVGNAAAATAEKGRAVLDAAGRALALMLSELHALPLETLVNRC